MQCILKWCRRLTRSQRLLCWMIRVTVKTTLRRKLLFASLRKSLAAMGTNSQSIDPFIYLLLHPVTQSCCSEKHLVEILLLCSWKIESVWCNSSFRCYILIESFANIACFRWIRPAVVAYHLQRDRSSWDAIIFLSNKEHTYDIEKETQRRWRSKYFPSEIATNVTFPTFEIVNQFNVP